MDAVLNWSLLCILTIFNGPPKRPRNDYFRLSTSRVSWIHAMSVGRYHGTLLRLIRRTVCSRGLDLSDRNGVEKGGKVSKNLGRKMYGVGVVNCIHPQNPRPTPRRSSNVRPPVLAREHDVFRSETKTGQRPW